MVNHKKIPAALLESIAPYLANACVKRMYSKLVFCRLHIALAWLLPLLPPVPPKAGVLTKILSGNHNQCVGNVIPRKPHFQEGFHVYDKKRHHSINHFGSTLANASQPSGPESCARFLAAISANHRVTMAKPFNKERDGIFIPLTQLVIQVRPQVFI